MSRRKKPERRPSVSSSCVLYCCSAVFFLATGIARGELVASLCGALLACYLAFCLAFALLARVSSSRASVSLSWSDAKTVVAKLSPRRTRFFRFPFPGPFADATLVALYRIIPETPYTDAFVLSIPLRAEESSTVIEPPPRGRYEPMGLSLVVSDFSGFFSFSRTLPDTRNAAPFTVYPHPSRPAGEPTQPSVAGQAPGKSSYRKSDDLYDSRPYASGDDPRTINWNLYAHTGVPFIREGESLPPPADEYVISFISQYTEKPLASKRVKAEFDDLVDRVAAIALTLSRERKTLIFPSLSRNGACENVAVAGDSANSGNSTTVGTAEGRILDALSRVQPGHRNCRNFRKKPGAATGATELLFMTCDADPGFMSEMTPSGRFALFVGPWNATSPNAARLDALCASLAKGGFNVSKI